MENTRLPNALHAQDRVSGTDSTDPGVDREPHLQITECQDLRSLERFRHDWERLLAENPDLSIFCTPEWMIPWWNAYGQSKSLCVLVFSDPNNMVVAIAPLYREYTTSPLLPRVETLRLLGDGSQDSDDLDFIVAPGYELQVVDAFIAWLKGKPWHLCQLNCLSPRSTIAGLLLRKLNSIHWTYTSRRQPLTAIPLTPTWESYLAERLSSNERYIVRKRLRRLESKYSVRYYKCSSDVDLPACLNLLFELHQKRWEARGESGTFSVPERCAFYREMTSNLLSHGWLDLWFLELDGRVVATQIGLRYHNTVYQLQEGFDPALAEDSVGYTLRGHVLQCCIADGITKYDFLAGVEESKLRWGGQVEHYLDIHFALPAGLGAAHLRLTDAARRLKSGLREHLPAKLWTMLQRIRTRLRAWRQSV